jgi:LacI family transcriptional regulator
VRSWRIFRNDERGEEKVKRATIRDVAREAKVSVASVSRALNGLSSVTPEMRDHIRKVADRLGYVPHAGARSLSISRTNVIGVVLPDLHGEFFSELVRGMDRATASRGYQMLFSTMHADPDLARAAMMAMHGRVDGLIVMAPQIDPAQFGELIPGGIPRVLINSPQVAGTDQLRVDNTAGIEVLVRHFVERGAQRIVHITGPAGNLDADERLSAYREMVARYAPTMSARSVQGDFFEESGYDQVVTLLRDGEPFDAVLAANDGMALGALRALREAGRPVPNEIMVAGFDDVPLARHLGLTTVRVPLDEIGDVAVARIVARLDGATHEAIHHQLIPNLVIRATTDRSATP